MRKSSALRVTKSPWPAAVYARTGPLLELLFIWTVNLHVRCVWKENCKCVCVCVREWKKERACVLRRWGGGNCFTQNPVFLPPISFTPLLTRFSQRIYSPRGLLALLWSFRPQTGLCAAPLRQQGGRKQTSYTPRGAPDTTMSFCWPTHMTSQPGSHR